MAASLRSLLTVVASVYCFSVFVMLLHLPSIRYQLSLKIGHSNNETSKPFVHSHILLFRIAEERCANLTRRHKTQRSVNHAIIPRTGISIMNAYYDRRKPETPYIRLLVMKPMVAVVNLHCHVPLYSDRDYRTPATKYQFNENHGMTYGGYIFSCPLPPKLVTDMPLCFVRITNGMNFTDPGLEMYLEDIPRHADRMHNISSCVPPLFGDVNPRRLIEFIELNRLLGIEHFYFYDNTDQRRTELKKVFNHYISLGIMTKLLWKLPIARELIWYGGQMLAIHHCLYMNMGVSKYTVFQDLDEALVPRRHPDLITMLQDIDSDQRHCGFRFFSAFFTSVSPIRNLISLRKLRSRALSTIRTKCIVRPDLIFEMGIHHISKQNVEEKTPHNIPASILLLHHYRDCDRLYGMNCDDYLLDDTVHRRYGERLVKNYDNVVKQALEGI